MLREVCSHARQPIVFVVLSINAKHRHRCCSGELRGQKEQERSVNTGTH